MGATRPGFDHLGRVYTHSDHRKGGPESRWARIDEQHYQCKEIPTASSLSISLGSPKAKFCPRDSRVRSIPPDIRGLNQSLRTGTSRQGLLCKHRG